MRPHSRIWKAISTFKVYEAVRNFLKPLGSNPPEILIIFYVGHGKEINREVFLMPTSAKYEDADDCENTCTSHLKVLKWLKMYVDAPATQLAYVSPKRSPVRFLLILDMCRDGCDSACLSLPSDPAPQTAPVF